MENPLVMTEADQAQSQSGSELQGNGSQDDPNHKKQPPPNHVKKRTKTGCLTCRKRRIKCDEGRPTCNNCIKSKRLCEGYNQRVVFKDPMGGATYGDPYSLNFHPSGSSHGGHMHAKPPGQGPLPTIAPKPSGLGTQPQVNMQQFGQYSYGHGQPPMPPVYDFNQRPVNYPQFAQPGFFIPSQETPNYIQSSPGHAVLGQPPYEAPRMSDNSTAYISPPERPINQPWGEGIEEVIKTEQNGYQYDLPEDDASMLESDDETQDPREVLGPVVRRFSGIWDRNGTQVRAFSTFADSNLLSTYTAHAQLRELRDPRMLATFMHFLKVTGPSMSLYERHPFDRGDDENYDTKSNNLWTYTFPLIAFNHPGLLHAILALASLQIAKLQAVPATDAMRHYHVAIRRIAKNIKSPLRRTQPPTLAASLLLAYFEVWSSDHAKWCTHLFGTRILFREIAMSEMTRRCLPVKRMRQMQKDEEELAKMDAFYPGMRKSPRSHLLNLNYNLLSTIFGQTIRPEQYGLGDDQYIDLTHNVPSEKDVEQYETLRDLYWWYCKMDVYQSMLGGTKLFMEYDYWSQCPPRGPISIIDATYGTYDHLMLLLGRLANFSSLDLSRKRRAHRARTQSQDPNSPPSFPGIVPTQGKVDVPLGFTPEGDASSPLSDSDEPDPKASLHAAMQEWESIRQAFDAFKNHLGPEFQPLREEFSDRRDSPFGRTIQYRTFGVAGIWMNFYMGMIHLYRYHPHAPPAAMQAAGQAARQTAEYAIEIGKIAAGLADDCSHETQISTMVSAAFIESCFCLFVAAVQYQDDAQRHWLVRRMYDICRLTGWQTAKQIADGCESGWIKAAQMGRGQPYVRAPDIGADIPHLVKENPRRIDRVIKQELASGERNLVLAKSEQAYYALGLIGVEQDMALLTLKDE